jgi:hypothetical protein
VPCDDGRGRRACATIANAIQVRACSHAHKSALCVVSSMSHHAVHRSLQTDPRHRRMPRARAQWTDEASVDLHTPTARRSASDHAQPTTPLSARASPPQIRAPRFDVDSPMSAPLREFNRWPLSPPSARTPIHAISIETHPDRVDPRVLEAKTDRSRHIMQAYLDAGAQQVRMRTMPRDGTQNHRVESSCHACRVDGRGMRILTPHPLALMPLLVACPSLSASST